jgi:phosphohistidine phosphatase
MIIHVVRHAEAVDRSEEITEEHRYLTPRGRKRFRKVGKALRKAGVKPDIIVTSPMIRAVQTADILAEALRHKGELLVAPLLAGGFNPESLNELLDIFPEAAEIALVGHEPDVGRVAQALLAEAAPCPLPKGAVISFKRSGGTQGEAQFIQLVTGGGRIVTSKNKAVAHLQKQQKSS